MHAARSLVAGAALALLAVGCGESDVVSEPTQPAATSPAADQRAADGVGPEELPETPRATEAAASPTPSPTPLPTVRGAAEPADAEQAEPSDDAQRADASPTAVDDACVRLSDFDAEPWQIVNDGVMGGLSEGRAGVVDGILRFEGRIVTQGGGFSLVRGGLDEGELSGMTALRLRVRADDDRSYELIVDDTQTGTRSSVSYFGPLPTGAATGWVTVEVAFADLVARSFGTPVDAPPFRPDLAVSIGLILADGVDGPFLLEVDWVDACR